MADTKKPRCRLQFSLAGLFGMVTVWAVWLGCELNYIRERQAVRDLVTKEGGTAVTCADVAEFAAQKGVLYKPVSIPFWRRMLGDEAIEVVRIPSTARQLLARSDKAFPEAEICEFDIDDPRNPRQFRGVRRDRGEMK